MVDRILLLGAAIMAAATSIETASGAATAAVAATPQDWLDTTVTELCGIDCRNDSVCAEGDAAFPGHLPWLSMFQTTNVSGFYCRCRNSNQTGVDCGIPYRSCGGAATTTNGEALNCYYGGACPSSMNDGNDDGSNDDAVCDCSRAQFEGSSYTGRYCEIRVGDENYCNGDTVIDGDDNDESTPCGCPDGYTGPQCQYPDNKNGEDNDDCDMTCLNDGVCMKGSFVSSENKWRLKLFGKTTDRPGMYCQCPDGYDGLRCEYQIQVCGDGLGLDNGEDGRLEGEHLCLHGTVCTRDADSVRGWRCECPPDRGFCHLRTELCSPSSSEFDEYVEGLAVPSFCSNGGKCRDIVVNGRL